MFFDHNDGAFGRCDDYNAFNSTSGGGGSGGSGGGGGGGGIGGCGFWLWFFIIYAIIELIIKL